MKVYSIPNYNYNHNYNVQNRNLQKKDCPEPCFGNGQLTRFLSKRAPLLFGLMLGACALLTSCFKQEQTQNMYLNATINFDPGNVQPCHTDTVYIHDTIVIPGGDPTTHKPTDMYDPEHWALDIDTVDGKFTDKVDEKFWIQKYQYTNEFNRDSSKRDTTAYNGNVYEFAGSATQVGDYDSKRYFAVYNDNGIMKDITVEKRTYKSGDDNLFKPSTVYIVPRGTQKGAGTDYYYYDENNNLLEHRWRLPQGDGIIYEFWGNPNNPSQQDVTVDRHTVNWSEVAPLNDGKGKN